MLGNYSSKCNKILPSNKSKTTYADNGKISSWAVAHVYKLQRAGVMNGSLGNNFLPTNNLTRAEAATVLCKFYSTSEYFASGNYTTPVPTATQATIDKGEGEYGGMDPKLRDIMSDSLLYVHTAAEASAKLFSGNYPNGSRSLNQFLKGTGGNAISNFDVKGLLNDKNSGQYKNMLIHLDDIMIAAECHAVLNKDKTFYSKIEQGFQTGTEESGNNWFLSLGYYRYWTRCTVKQTSSNAYTATITYNLRDYYDWDKNSKDKNLLGVVSSQMYNLHSIGYAKNYNASGSATIKVNWSQGKLASKDSLNITIS